MALQRLGAGLVKMSSGTTLQKYADRVKYFEDFGATGDGLTDDTNAMLSALEWLRTTPFGKLCGSTGAKYLIKKSLVMKFDGSYTQDINSTRYIDFTGTTLVAGASGITCLRMCHDYAHAINPMVINPQGFSDVIAYAIAPEDEKQTIVRVSQQFCVMENPRARGVKIGIKFKPGPTVDGSNSGAYYHSIMNPNFERVDCGFYFERSESGDNNNTRIHIYNPHHATGNCSFWIESTDSLRVFGGHSENIKLGTWPADVPCAVRVVKTVNEDTQVAGNLRFYGYFGELCTRGYQIDDNVGTYDNFFDWDWVFLDQEPYRAVNKPFESMIDFDGVVASSNWDPNQLNIAGCRRRKSGKQAVIIQKDDTSPAELYSDTHWTFKSNIIDAPIQDARNGNSDIQLLGGTKTAILLQPNGENKGITIEAYDGKTASGLSNGDLKIKGYNAFLPDSDNTTLLGYSSNRWSNVYSANGVLQTSDGRLKDIHNIEDAEIAAGLELSANMVKYNWAGEDKYHFGCIAQEVVLILEKYGLDPIKYSMVQYDQDADIFGVNYAELSCFCIAAMSRKVDAISKIS